MNIKVARKFGDNEQFLEDIILHSISDDEVNRLVIKAENGEVKNENENYLQLILRNGYRYEDILASTTAEKQKYPHTRASFDEYILNIDISEFNNVNLETIAIIFMIISSSFKPFSVALILNVKL